MDQFNFFCCHNRDWARVTAGFEIAYHTFSFTFAVIELKSLLSMGPIGFLLSRQSQGWKEFPGDESDYTMAVTVASVALTLLAGRVFMGILLLHGINQNRANFLNWWIIYANVCIGWYILVIVAGASISMTIVLRCLLFCLFYGLGICAVRLQLEEILEGPDEEEVVEDQSGTLPPLPPAFVDSTPPPSYEQVCGNHK